MRYDGHHGWSNERIGIFHRPNDSVSGGSMRTQIIVATIFQIEQFHTITVVYLSYPVTWFITLAAHCVCYVLIMKHIKKEIPNESLIGKRQSS